MIKVSPVVMTVDTYILMLFTQNAAIEIVFFGGLCN